MSEAEIRILDRRIGSSSATYIIAEISANHNQEYKQAEELIYAAKEAGVDAVKLQTYTPDTITIKCDSEYFKIKGTIWNGRILHDLYGEAYTPWDWQPRLKEVADNLGLHLFSSPFDTTAVDFLEKMDVPAYKIASFELVDHPLIEYCARTGKPIIMSTGMATLDEIAEAVQAARSGGCTQLALLKCSSAYPAPANEMNLRTIPHLATAFNVPVGLSDHTIDIAVPISAVALGASIIEKHITLSRATPGPDSAFSLEPHEFKSMVTAVRQARESLGVVNYGVCDREAKSRIFRRSLFVVSDVCKGERFTSANVRSIRPGHGLAPKYLQIVLGNAAACDIPRGTPLEWAHLGGRQTQ